MLCCADAMRCDATRTARSSLRRPVPFGKQNPTHRTDFLFAQYLKKPRPITLQTFPASASAPAFHKNLPGTRRHWYVPQHLKRAARYRQIHCVQSSSKCDRFKIPTLPQTSVCWCQQSILKSPQLLPAARRRAKAGHVSRRRKESARVVVQL
ncbi:hypothetical protein BU26DRAFT_69815 [Trematosphaeria pertusa]|uniref:Uncharacterized protein n=1 Tax=Trematosphaeria pertusa TaxID=390896 RepID=A0A6A6I7K0_9PLEO|nr:uncharacterized protein BU26DRAFT_69815 [Trematosphaeria pertusa]KAF2245490.1 hypothetical protein BU26DRAFT_69815 [Trematosphaeria pertusa]